MAVALGKIFDVQVSETAGRGMVMTALASMIGPVVARVTTQIFVGWLPWIGNTVNATTAAAITEAVGWNLAYEFEKSAEQAEPPTEVQTEEEEK